jgi:hypothetical protein
VLTPLQTGIELQIALLAVVLLVVFGTYRVIKAVKPLVVNAVVGLIVILLAGVFGFGVEITPILILLVAFGGVPAAILAIILAEVGLVFQSATVLAPLLL